MGPVGWGLAAPPGGTSRAIQPVGLGDGRLVLAVEVTNEVTSSVDRYLCLPQTAMLGEAYALVD